MHSPVADLLADLAGALEGAGVSWFLFGAQAAILHGAARLTADVDVTVRLPPSLSNVALAEALERQRFRRRIADSLFTEKTRVLPLVHLPTTLPVDIVLAGPGIEDQFFDRVQVREIGSVPVRVASPEDIIVMKVLAGRPKDIDDVMAITAAYAEELDRAYIEVTLVALEQALSQSDLLPVWHQIVARSRPGR
jgi:Nucleotidyltransferase of unknown function (DUF6036)